MIQYPLTALHLIWASHYLSQGLWPPGSTAVPAPLKNCSLWWDSHLGLQASGHLASAPAPASVSPSASSLLLPHGQGRTEAPRWGGHVVLALGLIPLSGALLPWAFSTLQKTERGSPAHADPTPAFSKYHDSLKLLFIPSYKKTLIRVTVKK